MSSARIWVISDTHFFHENIYQFTRQDGVTRVRPEFAHANEADAEMVQRWNATVQPVDHVYHLGDVTMLRSSNQARMFVEFIHTLNGHKRLILGNHDHFPIDVYQAAGFQKIRGSHRPYRNLIMSHIPIHTDSLPKDGICVHGHIHERLVMASPHHPDARYKNVSVEQINYTPVLLESLRP